MRKDIITNDYPKDETWTKTTNRPINYKQPPDDEIVAIRQLVLNHGINMQKLANRCGMNRTTFTFKLDENYPKYRFSLSEKNLIKVELEKLMRDLVIVLTMSPVSNDLEMIKSGEMEL